MLGRPFPRWAWPLAGVLALWIAAPAHIMAQRDEGKGRAGKDSRKGKDGGAESEERAARNEASIQKKIADIDATSATKAAMNELWRRGFCQLSAVYRPAEKNAPVPKNIGDVPVIEPRHWFAKSWLLCYTADGPNLWAADDARLYQINVAEGVVTRTFTAADGLPASPAQSLAVLGKDVWIATRKGLARLDSTSGRIEPVAGIFASARPSPRRATKPGSPAICIQKSWNCPPIPAWPMSSDGCRASPASRCVITAAVSGR